MRETLQIRGRNRLFDELDAQVLILEAANDRYRFFR